MRDDDVVLQTTKLSFCYHFCGWRDLNARGWLLDLPLQPLLHIDLGFGPLRCSKRCWGIQYFLYAWIGTVVDFESARWTLPTICGVLGAHNFSLTLENSMDWVTQPHEAVFGRIHGHSEFSSKFAFFALHSSSPGETYALQVSLSILPCLFFSFCTIERDGRSKTYLFIWISPFVKIYSTCAVFGLSRGFF